MKIESKNNNQIVNARKIWQDKKFRNNSGLIWIEGIRLIQEAIKSNCEIESIFVTESKNSHPEIKDILAHPNASQSKVYIISENIEKILFEVQSPQGIGALIYKPYLSSKDLSGEPILILDGVQDPGNLGTLIRSAEAAGVGRICTLSGTGDVWSGKVIRSSMGSVFRIAIDNIEIEEFAQLKLMGYSIIGTESINGVDYRSLKSDSKIALVLGSEGNGIKKDVKELLDSSVFIPMKSPVESLNVAIAGSILMFHFFGKN